jgi:hypothetical protein
MVLKGTIVGRVSDKNPHYSRIFFAPENCGAMKRLGDQPKEAEDRIGVRGDWPVQYWFSAAKARSSRTRTWDIHIQSDPVRSLTVESAQLQS